jgi:hypothetical protein
VQKPQRPGARARRGAGFAAGHEHSKSTNYTNGLNG